MKFQHMFPRHEDYKTKFTKVVDELVKRVDLPVPERNRIIDELTHAYVMQTGEVPDGYQLERLANYILHETLSDRDPDKVTNTEYPILSDEQVKDRMIRELTTEDMNRYSKDTQYQLNGRKKTAKIYE